MSSCLRFIACIASALLATLTCGLASATEFSPAVAEIVSAPPEGKGQIVFFRPSRFTGGAVGFKVREAKVELGKLRSGNYFIATVEPGLHTYTVHSEAKDVLNLEVEPGETYFLMGTVSMGLMVGRPNLAPSDAAAFEKALPKLKPSKPLKPKS